MVAAVGICLATAPRTNLNPVRASAASPYAATILADHPAVYWRLNETSGTTAADSSGNGQTGTYSATPTAVAGALVDESTTGVSNVSVTDSSANMPTGAASRTVEFWFQVNNGNWTTLMQSGDWSNHQFSVVIGQDAYIKVLGDNGAVDEFQLPQNYDAPTAWHLLDVVYDGTNVTLYADGQLAGAAALIVNTVGGNGLQFAAPGSDGLDEAAVYSAALTAAQVDAHWSRGGTTNATCAPTPTSRYASAVLADHPSRYYRLNDLAQAPTDRVAADISGNCHNGAIGPGINALAQGPMVNEQSGALTSGNQGGNGGNVLASADGWVTGAASRTVEFWQRTTTNYNYSNFLSGAWRDSSHQFSVSLQQGVFVYVYGDGSASLQLQVPNPYDDGQWHLFDITYDGSTAVVYYDGQTLGSGALLVNSPLGNGIMLQDIFSGAARDLAEVALFPTALSPQRVSAHWTAGSTNLPSACASAPAAGYAQTVNTDGAVIYLPLWDRALDPHGRVAFDLSGRCQNGAIAPSIGWQPNGAPIVESPGGLNSGGINSGGWVTANGNNLPTGAQPRTIEVWYRTDTDYRYTLLSSGGGSHVFGLTVEGSQTFDMIGDGNAEVQLNVNGNLKDHFWHLLDVSYDGTTARAYFDGVYQGGLALTVNTPSVGTGFGVQVAYVGDPHDVQAAAEYPTALSATQISNHFLAGEPEGGALTSGETAGGGNVCIPCLIKAVFNHGDPVTASTGNFYQSYEDLSVPGRGIPLDLTRTYNASSASSNGPFGYGWTFSYATSLLASGQTVTITQENGSQVVFTQQGSSYQAPPRDDATLVHNGDGSWTYNRRHRQVLTFSSGGQLTSDRDRNGYTTTLSYSGGQLSTVTDPAGRSLTFSWQGGHIVGVTDPMLPTARVVSYGYNDSAGDLTDVTDVNSGNTHFTYDTTTHRLTQIRDPRGNTETNHYDAQGRIDWQRQDQLNRTTTFGYQVNGPVTVTTITDPAGNVTVETYTYGVRTQLVRGAGTAQAATTIYAYDQASLGVTDVVDPNGHVWQATHDVDGNTTATVDPLGRTTSATYNSFDEPLTQTDGNGVATTSTYDTNGNLTSVSTPLVGSPQSQTTTYRYGDSSHPGDVSAVVDPDGKTWSYSYDSFGDRTTSADPLGDAAAATYNNIGWRLSSVAPKGNVAGCGCASQYTTTYGYVDPSTQKTNEFGDVVQVTDPLGHVTLNGYDANRNLTSTTDGDGNTTTNTFDAANELTQTKRADGTVLTTDYNPDGTLHDQKDGRGNVTVSYGYDALARVTSTTDGDGRTTTFTHDAAGNETTQQDPGGNCASSPPSGCTARTYDAADEVTGISYSDGTTPNVTGIAYDADGQRTALSDGSGSWSWSFDSLHRLTSVTEGSSGTVSYEYNLRDEVTAIAYPGGSCQNGTLCVTRSYDDAGRWTGLSDWSHRSFAFGYDPNGNLTTETFPANTAGVFDQDAFSFDSGDHMTGVAVTKYLPPLPPVALSSTSYTRDANNQLTSDSSQPPTTSAYRYTQLNQLCYAGATNSGGCGSAPPQAISYSFDAADNMTLNNSEGQAFDAAHQLCWTASGATGSTSTSATCPSAPSGATTYSYDTRGNRVGETPATGTATTLGFDQADRLIKWTQGSATTSYTYSGDGLRMSKTAGSATSPFAWDLSATPPLALTDGVNAYIYGPGGLPVEQTSASATLFFHHDQIGSTRELTDGNGVIQGSYQFDSYGNQLSHTGNATSPLLYGGQYQDAESGLYFLRARYYDPASGQFLSRDPAVSVTLSPYGYVSGDPLNSVDPTGLVATDCTMPWSADNPICYPADAIAAGAAAAGAAIAIGADVWSWLNSPAAPAQPVVPPQPGFAAVPAASPSSWATDEPCIGGIATLWLFAKQAPQLSDAERQAIENKNAGLPYDEAAYNSGMQKLRTGEKYAGQRRSAGSDTQRRNY